MLFNKRKYAILIFTAVFVNFCSKKKDLPYVSQSPIVSYGYFAIFQDGSESALISFKVTDLNGDIGHVRINDTTKNVYVNYYYKDTISQNYVAFYSTATDSLKTGYTMIANANNNLYSAKNPHSIGVPRDELDITLFISKYRHSPKIKHIKYVIYVFDDAGNKSNVVTTPEITAP